MIGYVVESRVVDGFSGARSGTARIFVGTRARAMELAGQKPGATWREIPFDEMPRAARENLERALGA